jgi:hypothetical protein
MGEKLPTGIKRPKDGEMKKGSAPASRLQQLLHETKNRRQQVQAEELEHVAGLPEES